MHSSLGYNFKSQELAFGKVASDSKNVLAQGEIYAADERDGDQGWMEARFPWCLLEPLHLFYFMWCHCHFLTLMV